MSETLSERDALSLSRNIVTELRTLGANVQNFGVHLEREGFWFMAEIDGRNVWVRTGQGNFQYRDVALELLAASVKAQADPSVHVA